MRKLWESKIIITHVRHTHSNFVVITVVRLFIGENNTHEHKRVMCACMLFPGEASQQDLLWNNFRMGKYPEAHSRVHCISHTAASCYDSIPFFPNPFISSSPLHHPFIISHRSLWLKETVMENRIRSQEDIWLHSFSVVKSVRQILTEIPHVSNPTPASLHLQCNKRVEGIDQHSWNIVERHQSL